MNGTVATLLLVAATLIMIATNIFGSDGTMADATVQKDRAHTISQDITVLTDY